MEAVRGMQATVGRGVVGGALCSGGIFSELDTECFGEGIATVEDEHAVGAVGEAEFGLEEAGVVFVGGELVAGKLYGAIHRIGNGRSVGKEIPRGVLDHAGDGIDAGEAHAGEKAIMPLGGGELFVPSQTGVDGEFVGDLPVVLAKEAEVPVGLVGLIFVLNTAAVG